MPEVPTLVCLHALGGSRHGFDVLAAELGDGFDVLAIDLPGFGSEPAASGTSVEEMAAHVTERIRGHLDGPRGWGRWLLVGHSMGGKVATVVAASTLRGATPLFGLAGVVLLAASPPAPEPMAESKRAELLGWVADGPLDEAAARSFISANVGSPLPTDVDAAVARDLRRADPEAWRAWLERGSLEDWSSEVGALNVPALIVGGDADSDLGAEAQPRINGPAYPRARYETLDGAGHLLPLERPAEVAGAIRSFWETHAGRGPVTPPPAASTIASSRTGARARSALAARAVADDPAYAPRALSARQLDVLRAVADRVVPQDGPAIDLAARVDAQLAAGAGNGWRFAELPPDVEAYRRALDHLDALPTLAPDAQDELLARLGTVEPWLERWFEDARDDLIRHWLAHPASLARVGFDGYANGGDGLRMQGFSLVGVGEREAWEPVGTPENQRR